MNKSDVAMVFKRIVIILRADPIRPLEPPFPYGQQGLSRRAVLVCSGDIF